MKFSIFPRVAAAALAAALLPGLSACAPMQELGNAQAIYDASIADAAVASPDKVVALKPVPPEGMVTVISWVTQKRLPCAERQQCELKVGDDRMWVTLAGEVASLCRSWNLTGDALRQRLEQLLGLPPDPPAQYQKAWFVEMRVPRESMERPCLGVDNSNPARPRCTVTRDAAHGGSTEIASFVGQQMAAAYVVGASNGPGYPYTRLGYTYDWNPAAAAQKHYGASEFVVAPGTVAKVTAQYTTGLYCASVR